ncbi:MAG: 50S ribosomal protein L6 [Acidobacteriota bacterium]|nr:50S ribosomal protein L6 [Acidobacteriota bacterium]
MSRIGKLPIPIPPKVEVKVEDRRICVKGPKGELQQELPAGIQADLSDGILQVKRADDSKSQKALHGLLRALLANAVQGVHEGFTKNLEIEGIGFRAQLEGRELTLNLGFSHPVRYKLPQGIDIKIEKQVRLAISGVDRQVVGQAAAEIRGLRPPDVYKGKGIRYAGEFIKKKAGKRAATA